MEIREEIRRMTGEEIEARMLEIKAMLDDDDADIEALTQEVAELREARQARLEEAEKRNALLDSIANEEVPVEVTKIKAEERKVKTLEEIRSSNEYAQAYAKMLVKGNDEEVRALLTDQVNGGYVPVPTFLESKIETAWNNNQIMSLVKKSNFKGIVKVGFELSAGAASVHVEGANAPNEETVTLGAVEIKPQTIKKWIRVSDEALEETTVDTLDYIYDEITYQIAKKAESIVIKAITDLDETATSTQVNVGITTISALAKNTILNALAKLQDGATDLYLVMNRGTYAALRNIELNASYGVDVFEGLKDRVIFTDALKSFDAASANDVVIIAGDFGKGCQVNFPTGLDDVKIVLDNLSEAEKDLVKIVGSEKVGVGIIGPMCFSNVVIASSTSITG